MKHGSNDLIPQEMYINLLCMNDIPPRAPDPALHVREFSQGVTGAHRAVGRGFAAGGFRSDPVHNFAGALPGGRGVQGGLAQILAMDRRTLTQTLRIMAGRSGSESAVARTGENGCCGWRKLADINSTARFLPGKRRKHSWGDCWETSAGTPLRGYSTR